MKYSTEELKILSKKAAENLADFLNSACYNTRFKFIDQLILWNEKPDGTYFASTKMWNEYGNRYVNKGSKAIFLSNGNYA